CHRPQNFETRIYAALPSTLNPHLGAFHHYIHLFCIWNETFSVISTLSVSSITFKCCGTNSERYPFFPGRRVPRGTARATGRHFVAASVSSRIRGCSRITPSCSGLRCVGQRLAAARGDYG